MADRLRARAHSLLTTAALLALLLPVPAAAQAPSGFWFSAGGSFTTLRGDCQTCETDTPHRHGPGVLAAAGYRVRERLDAGAEVLWMPIEGDTGGRIHTLHIDAVAQLRLWRSAGFFVKGGAGLAIVRNWIDANTEEPLGSKALSVVVGAGWEFRPARRLRLQIIASQHAAALGDFRTTGGDVPDVIGNFWSLGAAIVVASR